jgi:glycosyltransferase involved in cell wall biosynthesis
MSSIRILDLGCHDGFVSNWVARQLQEDGHEVIVDGVELHPQGVEIARRRAREHGIAGEYQIGLAEDAPDLFEPGAYDAVIAFELIEHVPDVDRFLTSAETMLKPGGRIYLSTPDGTFGAGQNPHHLRVYRAVDLVDLCRRRGRLEDMIVGPDTISVLAYVPHRSALGGDVAIYCGPGWTQWAPSDIVTRGLGGSETAAVRLAEALSDLGHTVTVYGECHSVAYRQTVFRHWTTFDPTAERACVISSRIPELFDREVNAATKLLWVHDVDCGPRFREDHLRQVDAVLCLSQWHESHLSVAYPWLPDSRITRISNAIEPNFFRGKPQKREHQVIYSSSPDRGLDVLMSIWPEVLKQEPEAVLAYCYADVYDAVAEQNPVIRRFRDSISELEQSTPNLRKLGSLPQQELAKEMARSKVWAHPSWNSPGNQPFHETYCIGAVEAAAAGCFRIGSSWGALPERRLERTIDTLEPELWAEAIVEGLRQKRYTRKRWALETTWDKVAEAVHCQIRPTFVPIAAAVSASSSLITAAAG